MSQSLYICMYVCMFIGMNEQVRRREWADVRPISEVGPGRHALMGSYIIEYIHTYMQLHFHTHFKSVTMCGCERFWASIITEYNAVHCV